MTIVHTYSHIPEHSPSNDISEADMSTGETIEIFIVWHKLIMENPDRYTMISDRNFYNYLIDKHYLTISNLTGITKQIALIRMQMDYHFRMIFEDKSFLIFDNLQLRALELNQNFKIAYTIDNHDNGIGSDTKTKFVCLPRENTESDDERDNYINQTEFAAYEYPTEESRRNNNIN